MSGPQTEGAWRRFGKVDNLWDTWSNERIEDFHNRVGSYAGNDFTDRHNEDFAILRDLGLTSWRTSIQWSRLMDADGRVNPEGAAYYHELFADAKKAGLETFVCLYHFDMPTYLFRRGGWDSREVVEAYGNYARAALEEMVGELRNRGGRQADPDGDDGMPGALKRGIVVRHLVLPGHADDSCAVLDTVWDACGNDCDLSVMNQYTPNDRMRAQGGSLARGVTEEEYELVLDHADDLGFERLWWQQGGTVSESFVPAFDATGVAGSEL